MDDYLSEKEQVEQIKQWWDENGRYIILGLVLGGGALFGWKAWQKAAIAKSETASSVYEQIMTRLESEQYDGIEALGEELRNEYSSTPYAAQADLALARYYVDQGDLKAAEQRLTSALDAKDEAMRRVARLRLARVQLELGNADTALATLEAGDPGEFATLYHEARGDVLAATGDNEGASRAYQDALEAIVPGVGDRNLLEMKRDAQGGTTAAAADESGS